MARIGASALYLSPFRGPTPGAGQRPFARGPRYGVPTGTGPRVPPTGGGSSPPGLSTEGGRDWAGASPPTPFGSLSRPPWGAFCGLCGVFTPRGTGPTAERLPPSARAPGEISPGRAGGVLPTAFLGNLLPCRRKDPELLHQRRRCPAAPHPQQLFLMGGFPPTGEETPAGPAAGLTPVRSRPAFTSVRRLDPHHGPVAGAIGGVAALRAEPRTGCPGPQPQRRETAEIKSSAVTSGPSPRKWSSAGTEEPRILIPLCSSGGAAWDGGPLLLMLASGRAGGGGPDRPTRDTPAAGTPPPTAPRPRALPPAGSRPRQYLSSVVQHS